MALAQADRARGTRSVTRGPRTRTVDTVTAVAMLTPAMIAFVVFVIVPAVAGLVLAFFRWNLFGEITFVGTDNLVRLVTDDALWQALGVTVAFVVTGVVPTIVIGFLLAVLINVRLPGIAGLRVLYLAPMIASAAVASIIWATLYNPRIGLVNQVLGWVGIDGPNWLTSPVWARPALVLMMIWGALPLVIILYLAGLQRVPEDVYAAASLDGAAFISGSFEVALIMTDGGPLATTQTIALYAYKVAFEQRDIGYASALSLFQLALLAIGVVVGRLLQRRSRWTR